MTKFENVSFSYGEKPIIVDWTFSIPETGVTCLFGPSGCGKTTVFRLLCGLEAVSSGQIVDGPKCPAVVFQEDRLLPWISVLENVLLGISDNPTKEDQVEAQAMLESVGLGDMANAYPEELSGGMSRRVALVRALLHKGDMLLLDEPFAGLEEDRIRNVAEMILKEAQRKPVMLITHKKEEAEWLHAHIVDLSGNPSFPHKKKI